MLELNTPAIIILSVFIILIIVGCFAWLKFRHSHKTTARERAIIAAALSKPYQSNRSNCDDQKPDQP